MSLQKYRVSARITMSGGNECGSWEIGHPLMKYTNPPDPSDYLHAKFSIEKLRCFSRKPGPEKAGQGGRTCFFGNVVTPIS